MKTSVIEVRDMLSVLSVDGVEKRIGEVPGVESVTVNFAAGSATVRYDETRLVVADIKSAVRQRAYASEATDTAAAAPAPVASAGDGQKDKGAPPSAPLSTPVVAAPKADAAPPLSAGAPLAVPAPPTAAPAAGEDQGQAEPGVIDKVTSWVKETFVGEERDQATPEAPTAASADAKPKPAGAGTAESKPVATASKGHDGHEGHEGHAPAGGQPAMSADMGHEMGHADKDLGAMVRDMRNRFWICLIFTVPIFVYAPMGGMWQAPVPPFGLELDLWLFFFASAAILYPSWPFFVSAWRALLKGTLGMAALIVLSVGTGYIFSVGSTFSFEGGGQFFEAVAVLLVFILLGH